MKLIFCAETEDESEEVMTGHSEPEIPQALCVN